MNKIGTQMADRDVDWLVVQAKVSMQWLESLPAGSLSPTGVSLFASASEWLAMTSYEPLAAVEDAPGVRSRKSARQTRSENIQPPLMVDVPSPKG
jgi:hypothetical protein